MSFRVLNFSSTSPLRSWRLLLRSTQQICCESVHQSGQEFFNWWSRRATSTTVAHLASHAQGYVSHISPQKEISFLTTLKPRYIKQSTPRRTLYTNYYVGDCNDLIFGVSLVDYATSRGLQEGDIPKLVRICIQEVDKRGLNSEGIYRVSPGKWRPNEVFISLCRFQADMLLCKR